jgi:hypothetical protein
MKSDSLVPRDSVTGELHKYAWPGGYPIIYYSKDGGTLCPVCAQKIDDDEDDYDYIDQFYIYYEGPPEICDECSAEIESAYGDPNEDE